MNTKDLDLQAKVNKKLDQLNRFDNRVTIGCIKNEITLQVLIHTEIDPRTNEPREFYREDVIKYKGDSIK